MKFKVAAVSFNDSLIRWFDLWRRSARLDLRISARWFLHLILKSFWKAHLKPIYLKLTRASSSLPPSWFALGRWKQTCIRVLNFKKRIKIEFQNIRQALLGQRRRLTYFAGTPEWHSSSATARRTREVRSQRWPADSLSSVVRLNVAFSVSKSGQKRVCETTWELKTHKLKNNFKNIFKLSKIDPQSDRLVNSKTLPIVWHLCRLWNPGTVRSLHWTVENLHWRSSLCRIYRDLQFSLYQWSSLDVNGMLIRW